MGTLRRFLTGHVVEDVSVRTRKAPIYVRRILGVGGLLLLVLLSSVASVRWHTSPD
jgi:hypothetical protein